MTVAEFVIFRLAIDYYSVTRDFFTLKSSLNCYYSSLVTPNFLDKSIEKALLLAL